MEERHTNRHTRKGKRKVKWLITGGCGFIGANLVSRLRKDEKNRIRVLDNLKVGSFKNITPYSTTEFSSCFTDVELVDGDIRGQKTVVEAARGSDVIVHLAALPGVRESVQEPQQYFNNNVIGTFNILEAARVNEITNVIFASSAAAVGECKPPVNETKYQEPISPYGATKTCGEALCHAYHHSYKMSISSLRFSNVYGPYSAHKTSLVAKFIRRAINGKILQIYGSGNQTRDFIYVDDLVSAIIKLSILPQYGIFQLSTGIETSVNKVVSELVRMLKEKGIEDIQLEHISEQLGDMKTNWADSSKLRKAINWKPEVDLETGLWKTIDWFFKQKKRAPHKSKQGSKPTDDDLRFRRFDLNTSRTT